MCFFTGVQFLSAQSAEETVLRIDFYRCGDYNTDSVVLKEMFLQNNNSLGPKNMVDNINYGEYLVEAFNKQGDCIFRRGYSSLFNEWCTTEGAIDSFAYFEESVLIPYHKELHQVVFSIRDTLNIWHTQKTLDIPPFDALHYNKKLPKFQVKELQISGTAAQKLDILFLPDGYTKKEMDLFYADCQKAMNSILNSRPFNDCKDKINFRAVMAPSKESGTDYPHRGILKNTLLNSSYNTFGTERYLTTLSYHAVMNLASNAPADHIVILVNDADYGGGGFYNFYSLASAHNIYTPFLIEHEMGHGLSGLADEYYTSDVAYDSFYNHAAEPWEPNITTLVDFASKWDSLVVPSTPVPTPATSEYKHTTGVFEGGGYSATGVYRPAVDCTMKSVGYNNFCAACRAAITRVILWYAQ